MRHYALLVFCGFEELCIREISLSDENISRYMAPWFLSSSILLCISFWHYVFCKSWLAYHVNSFAYVAERTSIGCFIWYQLQFNRNAKLSWQHFYCFVSASILFRGLCLKSPLVIRPASLHQWHAWMLIKQATLSMGHGAEVSRILLIWVCLEIGHSNKMPLPIICLLPWWNLGIVESVCLCAMPTTGWFFFPIMMLSWPGCWETTKSGHLI